MKISKSLFKFMALGLFVCKLLVLSPTYASQHLTSVTGVQVLSGKVMTSAVGKKKALVVIFLSAVCPCSNSHVSELAKLYGDFKDFEFVGIHSNLDESQERTAKYFKNVNLPFPILQDQKSKMANDFKAYKTPHAFVVSSSGEILFQGGVSSSSDFPKAERNFLREALEDIDQGKKVRTPRVRTLGCAISRG